MTPTALQHAATFIAKGNLTPRVFSVRVDWNESQLHLLVQYFVLGEPGDDERELCELTLTELIAQFPDIQTAETQCLPASTLATYGQDGVVYCGVESHGRETGACLLPPRS